jgi:hypothetical protein
MKRVTTGFCVAATLGCIATLGAQTSTTPTPATAGQRTATTEKAREVSITGCLSKGADGKFMLTNARIDPAGSTSTTGTSGTSTSATPTTTPGTTAAGTTAANAPAMSWALMGGSDLDKHVGHKVQVSGSTAWDPAMDHSRMPASSSAAGSTAGTTAGTTTGTAAGTTGTSGTTATAATEEARKDMKADQPRLDVKSVTMIAPSCS